VTNIKTGKQEISHSSRTVLAGGAELECTWLGCDELSRPTIVFLHEGLGSVAMWREFPEQLCMALGCNGLVYSRQGYGRSAPLTAPRQVDFMHREAAEVLPAVLAAFRIDQPILFGHSDGGSIALLYSAFFPERPRACLVMAPHILVEDVSITSIAKARCAYEEGKLKERLARYHDDVDGAFYGWNDIWLNPAFRRWSIETLLEAIKAPVLAIQGEDDVYGTMEQIEGIARRVRRASLVKIAHCGHSPHRDQPQMTIDAVRQFLEALAD
jgi:pimeloyl-ACP methyl ester carboxylesterase